MTTGMMTKTIADYFKTQPVLKAWLFGSYSRGEQTKDSDVDILVLLDKSRPIGLKFFGMWNDLEELLGRKVDLVSDGTLLPFAQQSAEKERQIKTIQGWSISFKPLKESNVIPMESVLMI